MINNAGIRGDLPLDAARGAGFAAALVLCASILAVPVIRARATVVNAPEIAAGRATCVDRYNALVHQAESDLTRGDLPASLRLLRSAQSQLHTCAVRTTQGL